MDTYNSSGLAYTDYTMAYTCPYEQCWIEYTLSVKGDPQFYYTTYEDDGTVLNDSILMDCVDTSDGR